MMMGGKSSGMDLFPFPFPKIPLPPPPPPMMMGMGISIDMCGIGLCYGPRNKYKPSQQTINQEVTNNDGYGHDDDDDDGIKATTT